MSETDIVERLEQGASEEWSAGSIMEEAAAHIKVLRAEIDHLGKTLDKVHAQLTRASEPVHGPELERELLAGGRYHRDPWHPPECGGFQGSGD